MWIHLRNDEFYMPRPDIYDKEVLRTLATKEKIAISLAAKKMDKTLALPDIIYYVRNNTIFARKLHRIKDIGKAFFS